MPQQGSYIGLVWGLYRSLRGEMGGLGFGLDCWVEGASVYALQRFRPPIATMNTALRELLHINLYMAAAKDLKLNYHNTGT